MDAYLTYYNSLVNDTIDFYNGYSFVAHLLHGDHYFITDTTPREFYTETLSKYDKIFYSVSITKQAHLVKEYIDNRWLLGGPIFERLPEEYWNKYLEGTKIFKGSFEDYLGIPREDIFTPYWNQFVLEKKPIVLKYNATVGRMCYWGKCKFRRGGYQDLVPIERNIKKVYDKLPVYDFISYVYLYHGSISPKALKTVIECAEANPKENVVVRLHMRGDKEILNVMKEAKDLSQFSLVFGLETFSQTASDRLNRGVNIYDILECCKVGIEKGGKVLPLIQSKNPTMNKKVYEESLKTIEWIKNNLNPLHKDYIISGGHNFYTLNKEVMTNPGAVKKSVGVFFWDAEETEWPTEEVAAEFGDYTVEITGLKDCSIFERRIKCVLTEEQLKMQEDLMKYITDSGFLVLTKTGLMEKK